MRPIPKSFEDQLEVYQRNKVLTRIHPMYYPENTVVGERGHVGASFVCCSDGNQISHILRNEEAYLAQLAGSHNLTIDSLCLHTHAMHGGGLVLAVPEMEYGEFNGKAVNLRTALLSQLESGLEKKSNNVVVMVTHAICAGVPDNFTSLCHYVFATAVAKQEVVNELGLNRTQVMTHVQLFRESERSMYHLDSSLLAEFHKMSLLDMRILLQE